MKMIVTYGDVLLDESSNLHRLVSLDPGDPLLHQVATLHVQEQHPVLGLHLPGGDDLGEGVVEDGLVGDQVQEVDTVLVQSQDVLATLHRVAVPPHLKHGHIYIFDTFKRHKMGKISK